MMLASKHHIPERYIIFIVHTHRPSSKEYISVSHARQLEQNLQVTCASVKQQQNDNSIREQFDSESAVGVEMTGIR